MTSETIELAQSVRFSLDCGKNWRLGRLESVTAKNITVSYLTRVTETKRHNLFWTKTKRVTKRVYVTLNITEACFCVLSLGQYAEMKHYEKIMKHLYNVALIETKKLAYAS
jgi:hypothetical protein